MNKQLDYFKIQTSIFKVRPLIFNASSYLIFLWMLLAGFMPISTYAQTPTFHVTTDLVLTPVWVGDAQGLAVRNLKREDFEIEENGIPTEAARLGKPGEAPLELALLFDTSGSMISLFNVQRQAAIRFLERIMRPIDSVFLVSISKAPIILQNRTSSLEVAVQAINNIPSTSQATAFYNSIAKAAQMLQAQGMPEARRVMIAISDGEDNHSLEIELKDVLQDLQSANCLFYSLNPKGRTYQLGFLGRQAQENMEMMAKQTGGQAFIFNEEEALAEFYDRIAEELQNQYLLGYNSPAAGRTGGYRRIAIKVLGRPELQVKARPGYYPE
jgi:Ca-activated chloride channel family protein